MYETYFKTDLSMRIKRNFTIVIFILIGVLFNYQISYPQDFKNTQLQHNNVRVAFAEKDSLIKVMFRAENVKYPPAKIFIRGFKDEKILELWASSYRDSCFNYIKGYKFAGFSGDSGPKRQGGDGQIPEGFYYINYFQHNSSFFLSLMINYPNKSDSLLCENEEPGRYIFIHGGSATIGCIPITDEGIKELYVISVEAESNGQDKIPVHIFPARLNNENMKELSEKFSEKLRSFWKNLKTGYDFFEDTKKLPLISVDRNGRYLFN